MWLSATLCLVAVEVSSVYAITLLITPGYISHVYNIKSNGPRTLPWGTPEDTWEYGPKVPSTWTSYCLPTNISTIFVVDAQSQRDTQVHIDIQAHTSKQKSVCECACLVPVSMAVALCEHLCVHACLHVWLPVALSASTSAPPSPSPLPPQLRRHELLSGADQGQKRPWGGRPGDFLLHWPHVQVIWETVVICQVN